MTPLDSFHDPAMWGVLAVALIVLAARVAWAVWRSLRDERDPAAWGGFCAPVSDTYPMHHVVAVTGCGCPEGCPCQRGPNDYCRCTAHGPFPYDWRNESWQTAASLSDPEWSARQVVTPPT